MGDLAQPVCSQGVARDSADRKLTGGTALRDSDELSRSLIASLPMSIYSKDLQGRLIFANDRFCEMMSKPRDELLGKTDFDLYPPEVAERHTKTDDHIVSTRCTVERIENSQMGERRRVFRVVVSPVFDAAGEVIGTQGIFWDVTPRVRMQQRLRLSRERSRHLSRQLLEAQENERHRLARELHDEVGQTLTAMKLSLLRLNNATHPAESGKEHRELLAMTSHLLEQVRTMSLELHPPMLDHLGLMPTLRWLLERRIEANGLGFQLRSVSAPHSTPRGLQTVCFRIVQEALTNVLRHARACMVEVQVDQTERELEFFIRDDGTGFDLEAALQNAAVGKSMGLLGMQERANLAGGTLTIATAPNEGATIHVRLPLTPHTHLERRHRRREEP